MTRALPIFLALLLGCPSARAEGPARNDVLQKELFVRRLLESAQPPAASDAPARALHARALEHFGRGELDEADARLNEAVRSVQRERRAHAAPLAQARPRYASLFSSVETMRDTYARFAVSREDSHGMLLAEVDEALRQARELSAGGRPAEAVRVLELAEQSVTYALTRALGPITVSYALRFAGAEDEYRHELARNRAYAALVPAAVNELRPAGAALVLVQRYVESADAAIALAARQAERREWAAALDSAQGATRYLQRSLGAAGLAVPEGIQE